MLACIVAILLAKMTLSEAKIDELRIVYYAEALALVSFGIAWIVSGKSFRLIAEEDEMLKIFRK